MRFEMNKYFFLNPENFGLRSVLSFSVKTQKTYTLIPKKDVTASSSLAFGSVTSLCGIKGYVFLENSKIFFHQYFFRV